MGIDSEPQSYIENFKDFEVIWDKLDTGALIANINAIDKIRLAKIHGSIVYEGPDRMVIIKAPFAHQSPGIAIAGAP